MWKADAQRRASEVTVAGPIHVDTFHEFAKPTNRNDGEKSLSVLMAQMLQKHIAWRAIKIIHDSIIHVS